MTTYCETVKSVINGVVVIMFGSVVYSSTCTLLTYTVDMMKIDLLIGIQFIY